MDIRADRPTEGTTDKRADRRTDPLQKCGNASMNKISSFDHMEANKYLTSNLHAELPRRMVDETKLTFKTEKADYLSCILIKKEKKILYQPLIHRLDVSVYGAYCRHCSQLYETTKAHLNENKNDEKNDEQKKMVMFASAKAFANMFQQI